MDKRYLGNGVFVEYDGRVLILTVSTPGNKRSIYMTEGVIDAFAQFNRDVAAEIRERQAG